MTVILTGCAGFIGMHAALRMLTDGMRVVGIDNLNSYYDVTLKKARLAQLTQYPNFHFHELDIINQPAIADVFAMAQPQKVIHLAAQAGVRYSIENPHAYIQANVQGFMTILECCRQHSISHLLYASSSSVYGHNTILPFHESSTTDYPLSIYAATKKANELMAHTYSHLYKIPTTGLRFFTVYGPWGRPDMAFFKFTRTMLAGERIEVFNQGEMLRDFTYIDDIVEGIIRVLNKEPQQDSPYRIFNIGNNEAVPLNAYIEALEQALGVVANKSYLPMQPGDVWATEANTQALADWIDFKPATPIALGIERFVEWYKGYYA